MLRHLLIAAVLSCSYVALSDNASADQRAYGRAWGGQSDFRDWNRFYHYPYVYYPQNFWDKSTFGAATACITGIRPKCGFRFTTRSGTTTTQATAGSTRAITSFWMSFRHDHASSHSADEFRLLPLVPSPVGFLLFI